MTVDSQLPRKTARSRHCLALKPSLEPIVIPRMLVFLDFEASSLGKRSYPIEVAWVFEDGRSATSLIRPLSAWTDWDPASEAIHRVPRARLDSDGVAVEVIANRMVDVLAGHDLLASAPSWDGKWLSVLLRGAGLPRRSLRLRGTDEALRETARAILAPAVPPEVIEAHVEILLEREAVRALGTVPVHRALADAAAERARWRGVRDAAEALATEYARG